MIRRRYSHEARSPHADTLAAVKLGFLVTQKKMNELTTKQSLLYIFSVIVKQKFFFNVATSSEVVLHLTL